MACPALPSCSGGMPSRGASWLRLSELSSLRAERVVAASAATALLKERSSAGSVRPGPWAATQPRGSPWGEQSELNNLLGFCCCQLGGRADDAELVHQSEH